MSADTNIRPTLWQPLKQPGFLRDMLLTLAAALLTGVSGGLLLILLVFGFGSVQAAESPGRGQLTLHALDGRPLLQATQGETRSYRVVEQSVIMEDAGWLMGSGEVDELLMVTCYPFDSPIPGGNQRYLVRAEPI